MLRLLFRKRKEV